MLGLIGEGTGIAAKVLKSMGKESLTCLSQLNYALFSDYERPSYPLTKQTWFFSFLSFGFFQSIHAVGSAAAVAVHSPRTPS